MAVKRDGIRRNPVRTTFGCNFRKGQSGEWQKRKKKGKKEHFDVRGVAFMLWKFFS